MVFEGRHKTADHFEEGSYVFMEQPNKEIPAYVVQSDGSRKKTRTLPRNHLLPVGHLPITDLEEPEIRKKEPQSRPILKPRKRRPGST